MDTHDKNVESQDRSFGDTENRSFLYVKSKAFRCQNTFLARKGFCTEEKILNLVVKDHSWEQIIFHLIEAEGLNPDNVDLEKLAKAFISYINKLEELDFHIP